MEVLQWLDFSPIEQEAALKLLDSQKDKSTVDELGLGLVRDAISDHLFPGLSTIQTRARYFLFVAWLLRGLEQGNVRDERLALTLRQREVALIKALLATDGETPETRHSGLIGRESRETTKRLPSTIYWSGLRRLGVYQGGGSLQEYLSDLPDLRRQRSGRSAGDEDGEGSDGDTGSTAWDPGLPDAPKDLLTESTFALSGEEARYLNEKVLGLRTSSGGICLFQWMVRHLDVAAVAQLESPWDLLTNTGRWPDLPPSLRAELTHAYHFALCNRALTAVYTRLLAAHRRDLDLSRYDSLLVDALTSLGEHAEALRTWHAKLAAFWRWVALVNPRLQRDQPFIDEWLSRLAAQGFSVSDPSSLLGTEVERWLQRRELKLKGPLARMGNPPVLQRWIPPERLGLTDYRWRIGRDIIVDILNGLGRTGGVAHA